MNRRQLLAATGTAAIVPAITMGSARAEPVHADPNGPVPTDAELARSLGDFHSAYATVNGVRLHYVTGGSGRPLVLLPGWPRTWWLFRKVLPALAKRYRVIAVDLRGMGGSAKPAGGYDKATMAADILGLVRHLGYDRVDIAGHDIGAMVAQSFAAHHPEALRRLALLDVLHPDERLYELPVLPQPGKPFLWWFAFNQVRHLPEQLLAGRFRPLLDWMCDDLLVHQSAVDEQARRIYAHAYSPAEAIRGSNGWYQAFGVDIEAEKDFPVLRMPILGLVSPGNYPSFSDTLPRKGTDVRIVKIEDTGHYLTEEQPDRVITELTKFLG